jgi:hypothetical protein
MPAPPFASKSIDFSALPSRDRQGADADRKGVFNGADARNLRRHVQSLK